MVYCLKCGTMIEDWDSGYYARQMYCIPCWDTQQSEMHKKPCRRCGIRVSEESGGSLKGSFYCGGCRRELEREIQTRTCFVCKKYIESWEKLHQSPDGKPICEKCFQTRGGKTGAKVCSRCGKLSQKFAQIAEDMAMCESCLSERMEHGKKANLASKLVAAFAVFAGS